MIEGVLSKSFSAVNIPPLTLPKQSFVQDIVEYSREKYAFSRQEIEKEIAHWELLDYSSIFKKETVQKPTSGIKEGWEAICSQCGKRIIVPFRPSPQRPIYCDRCFREIRIQSSKNKIKNKTQTNQVDLSKHKAIPKNKEIKQLVKKILYQGDEENKK